MGLTISARRAAFSEYSEKTKLLRLLYHCAAAVMLGFAIAISIYELLMGPDLRISLMIACAAIIGMPLGSLGFSYLLWAVGALLHMTRAPTKPPEPPPPMRPAEASFIEPSFWRPPARRDWDAYTTLHTPTPGEDERIQVRIKS